MTKRGLGEFEQQILLSILHLGGEAYSVPIVLEIERRGRDDVSQAAVYVVLKRMEGKGLLVSRREQAEENETSRERLYFRVLPEAVRQLQESRASMTRFWDGLESTIEGGPS